MHENVDQSSPRCSQGDISKRGEHCASEADVNGRRDSKQPRPMVPAAARGEGSKGRADSRPAPLFHGGHESTVRRHRSGPVAALALVPAARCRQRSEVECEAIRILLGLLPECVTTGGALPWRRCLPDGRNTLRLPGRPWAGLRKRPPSATWSRSAGLWSRLRSFC
jgi:hypothetical protein